MCTATPFRSDTPVPRDRFLGAVLERYRPPHPLNYQQRIKVLLKRCPYPSLCLRTKYHCTSKKEQKSPILCVKNKQRLSVVTAGFVVGLSVVTAGFVVGFSVGLEVVGVGRYVARPMLFGTLETTQPTSKIGAHPKKICFFPLG